MPEMQTLDRGLMSGLDEPRQAVVRDEAQWEELWKAHAPNRPRPRVDFATRAVIGVFLGSRRTGGYDVTITAVEPEGDGVTVYYRETRPRPGDMTAQVITSPFHIVATGPFTGPARFQHDERR